MGDEDCRNVREGLEGASKCSPVVLPWNTSPPVSLLVFVFGFHLLAAAPQSAVNLTADAHCSRKFGL